MKRCNRSPPHDRPPDDNAERMQGNAGHKYAPCDYNDPVLALEEIRCVDGRRRQI